MSKPVTPTRIVWCSAAPPLVAMYRSVLPEEDVHLQSRTELCTSVIFHSTYNVSCLIHDFFYCILKLFNKLTDTAAQHSHVVPCGDGQEKSRAMQCKYCAWLTVIILTWWRATVFPILSPLLVLQITTKRGFKRLVQTRRLLQHIKCWLTWFNSQRAIGR
jgi:hypothetical protein